MFVRYEINSTYTTGGHANLINDLAGIFNGTITSTAGFSAGCNIGLSTFTGTINTNLYSVLSTYAQATATYNSYLILKKYHSAKTVGYTPSSQMSINMSNRTTAPTAIRFASSTGTNVFPADTMSVNTTTSFSGTFDNAQTGYASPMPTVAANVAGYLSRVLIWANDNNLVIHFIYTNGSMLTGGIMDYESSASDQYAYNLNALATPQIYMASLWSNMTGLTPPPNGSSCGLVFGHGVYIQNNGTINAINSPWAIGNLDFHYGYQSNTASSLCPTIFPPPRFSQYSAPLSAGSSHFLTPIYYNPGFNNSTSSSSNFGKLPSFYRTTDDIADSGELITDSNNVTYAVLRLHKTKGYGAADYLNQTPNACYLIPV